MMETMLLQLLLLLLLRTNHELFTSKFNDWTRRANGVKLNSKPRGRVGSYIVDPLDRTGAETTVDHGPLLCALAGPRRPAESVSSSRSDEHPHPFSSSSSSERLNTDSSGVPVGDGLASLLWLASQITPCAPCWQPCWSPSVTVHDVSSPSPSTKSPASQVRENTMLFIYSGHNRTE